MSHALEGITKMAMDVSKVKYISVIRLEGGESILNIPYAELTVDPDLIAGFVTAVIIFARTPIRTIKKATYDILIEVGKTVLVLMVVEPIPDEKPYREKLQLILSQVEHTHGDRLEKFEGDVRTFRESILTILKEFPYSDVDLNLVPCLKKSGVQVPFRVGKVDSLLEQIENFINGKRTVSEILDLIGLNEEEVLALLSVLKRYCWIDFKRRLTENDFLRVSKCENEKTLLYLTQQYGKPVTDLMDAFANPQRVEDVIASLPYDKNAIWFLITKLVDAGCLKVIILS